jgi:hypothetical protein
MRNRNEHDHFDRRRFLMVPFVLLFLAAAGAAVMLLWNAILPALLGVKLITFWQSVGLLVLCRILFGHFGGGRPGGHRHRGRPHHPWDNRRSQQWGKAHSVLRQRLVRMNEEERNIFMEEWKKRMRP